MTKSEQWQQHLNLWHASGLSQVAFCQQRNIAVHNFSVYGVNVCRPRPN
ncbi:IS66 family insertion sequence element accessory protein TnpA [Thalassolituus oleivorans]|nr:hypothetical protein [Thalassolituus oleivorans]